MNTNETIVISGISGRFPECHNIEEFKEALLRGDDLMTASDERFPAGLKGLPKRQGKVPDIDKFDATFFGFHSKQAHLTDPRHRILLETAYEAIIDAGYNPSELRGSKTGVFIGLSLFTNFTELTEEDNYGYSILGASHVSAANRISYCFDFNGPSFALDTGCSSSLYAFTQAVDLLKSGEITYAIVGGTHLGLHPQESLQYHKLNMLSPEGKCKVFNKERNGFARSEAICCYFLQKSKCSRRSYAEVLGAKVNTNGYVKEGYTVPYAKMQLKLMQELYEESNVNIEDVTYVEMHGTGSKIGDIIECQSIVDMFCQNRKKPLLVGSVKSNMGHGETVSGLAAITKILLAMETGIIPANLHFHPIDKSLPGIGDKKLQIVTNNTFWKPGIVGINSFGFGGANAHVILKPVGESKKKLVVNRKHRLVQVSGRTEEGVHYFLNQIQKNQNDEGFLSLVDEIHKSNIEGHHFRGYTVMGQNTIQEVTTYKSGKRPIWFIFSGMGSHWPGMAKDLMNIEVFQNTFNRCAEAVKPYGIDLIDVIMSSSPSALENLGNCFTAIAAIDISLTDLLTSLGIKPDFFAGHSLGEVGCAYANGDLTPEQAVLLAYSKHYAVSKQELPLGQMAAVGLSPNEVKKCLPNDIYIACENGKNSVTISGPEQSVKDFVEKLTKQGVFARFVYTGHIAFHSKYLMDSDKHMLEFVQQVLPNPQPRSEKWITSSVQPEKNDEDWTKYNCAEYHTNNYKSTVLFNRIYECIQPNAIVVEIAPHGIMQPIMKKELSPENTFVSLLDKNVKDQAECLLTSIGRIFNAGGQPNLRNLYNEISFPVNSCTKMLAPLVKWDHNTTWFVPYWKNKDSFGQIVTINLSDEKYSYLKGHNIDGKVVMPATGYLEIVWKVRAEMSLTNFTNLPIVFENVVFKRTVTLYEEKNIEFLINIMKETGYFEIFQSGSLVVVGNIRVISDASKEFKIKSIETAIKPQMVMKKEDFYKEAHLRRYLYWNDFQGVAECDVDGLNGKLEWSGNYVSFLDSMLQISILEETSRHFLLPSKIRKVVIDPTAHYKECENGSVNVKRDPYCNIIKTKGIEISGSKFTKMSLVKKPQTGILMETFKFVYFDSPENSNYDFNTSLIIALQIIIQNTPGLIKKLTIGEVKQTQDSDDLTNQITQILRNQVMFESEYLVVKIDSLNEIKQKFEVIVIEENIMHNVDFKIFTGILRDNGFLIYIGNINEESYNNFDIIFRSSKVCLLRLSYEFPRSYDTINIRTSDFKWLEKLKNYAKDSKKRTVFLFSQNEEYTGIIGLQKCLMAEGTQVEFKAVSINDQKANIFSVDNEFYREQLSKGLALNVLKDEWGTFVHLPLEEIKPKHSANAGVGMRTDGNFSTLNWIEKPSLFDDSVSYERRQEKAGFVCSYKDCKNKSYIGANSLYGFPQDVKSTQFNCEIIDVYYAAFNFNIHNVATSNNILDENYSFGVEYSGKTKNNRNVMGLVQKGSLNLEISSNPDFTWDVPTFWSLEQAATVPLAYTMCYYGLIIKAEMKKNNSILIHDANTDIGIAAITTALSLDGTIFATVRSIEKQTFLKNLFPQLDFDNIGISSEFSFENIVKMKTKGKGVDVILNTLSEEYLEASLNCLSEGGVFLEIVNTNYSNGTLIDSDLIFSKQCRFHSIILNDIFEETSEVKKQINNLVKTGIEFGKVKPISSTTIEAPKIDVAFKEFSSKEYSGKILIKIRDQNTLPNLLSYPQLYFSCDKTYIIVGGLGGIGLELTNWLIEKGARKIILNARRNISNGYQLFCIKKWSRIKDVVIKIDLSDTTTLNGAEYLVKFAENLGPVGGVFNAAIVLKDANIIDQTESNFMEVFKPKFISGKNMDIATRKHCPLLDHFVVFSTVWAGRGHVGQTNYAMANSALENLCEKRRNENLPGLAVQWGPIGEVGRLAVTDVEQKELFNMAPQTISSCLDTLEKFIIQEVTIGSSIALTEKKKEIKTISIKTAAESVAEIFGIENLASINKEATLSQLGLDSLMLADVKHTLYRHFGLDFGPEEIRNLTFENLINLQTDNIKLTHKIVENFPPPLLSETPLVKMNDGGITENNSIVFMIHPIEGYLHYLTPLAKKLTTTVYGLQCTKESNFGTIQKNAQYFLKIIKSVQENGPYYICGYSYGSTLGFEIGLQLELEGEEVELVAIDGAPDYAREVFGDENEMNQKIIRLFPSLFKEVNLDKVKPIMSKYPKPEDSIPAIFELISQEAGYNLDDIKLAGNHYFSRCNASFYYQPNRKLNGKIKLIRRLHNPQANSDDYGLHKNCRKPVEVIKLNGDHITILFGDNLEKLSQIIIDWISTHKKNNS